MTKNNSFTFKMPEFVNSPLFPFFAGIFIGLAVVFLFRWFWSLRNKKSLAERLKRQDLRLSQLSSKNIVERSASIRDICRLFINLERERIHDNVKTNMIAVKDIIQNIENIFSCLIVPENDFFRYIAAWGSRSIEIRKFLMKIAQATKSESLNKEFKKKVSQVVEKATLITSKAANTEK